MEGLETGKQITNHLGAKEGRDFNESVWRTREKTTSPDTDDLKKEDK